jgi:hypothetical protein
VLISKNGRAMQPVAILRGGVTRIKTTRKTQSSSCLADYQFELYSNEHELISFQHYVVATNHSTVDQPYHIHLAGFPDDIEIMTHRTSDVAHCPPKKGKGSEAIQN